MPNPLNISDAPNLIDKSTRRIYLKNKKKRIPTDTGWMMAPKEEIEEWKRGERKEKIIKPTQDFPEKYWSSPYWRKRLWKKGRMSEYV